MVARRAALIGLLAFVVGCAGDADRPAAWKKEGVEPAEAARTESRCRSRANYDVEREYRAESDATSAGGSPDPLAGYTQTTRRYDAQRRIERLIADCMERQGFTRIR